MSLWEGACDVLGRLLSVPRCAACDAETGYGVVFCATCASTVSRIRSDEGARVVAAFAYGGAIAEAITRFKYGRRPDLARPLADLLWRALEPHARARGPWLVVPVPLHASRLAERGYNQSALLARRLAGRLSSARVLPLALARTRDTPRQATLGRSERLLNVADAFVARRPGRLAGSRVLLVDDVMTTGATLDGCERAIWRAGAREVSVAVLARAT